MADVLIVGCGLIGASVALAVSASGRTVLLSDADAQAVATAAAAGAGQPWDGVQPADLVVVATPPRAIAAQLARLQRLHVGGTYTHVSSVQSHVQSEVEALGCDLSSIVGGHPMAGGTSSGPGAASATLFAGRPWAVCASPVSAPRAVESVRSLASWCGAAPVEVDIGEHDATVALLSHLPQVAASALAAVLEASVANGQEVRLELAGPGVRDMTRLAASDVRLWGEILQLNAQQVAPAVRQLATLLAELAGHLEVAGGRPEPADAVRALLHEGNLGRARLPALP